jgi:hypothetical protein
MYYINNNAPQKKWKNRGRVQNSKYNLMLNKSIKGAEIVMLKFGCSHNHKRNILIVSNTGEKRNFCAENTAKEKSERRSHFAGRFISLLM